MSQDEEEPDLGSDVELGEQGYGTVVKRRPQVDDVWRRRESNAVVRVVQVVEFDDEEDRDKDCVLYVVLNPTKGERRVGGCEIKHIRRTFWFRGGYDDDVDYAIAFNRLEDLIEGWAYELDRRRFERDRVAHMLDAGYDVAANETRLREWESAVAEAERSLEMSREAYTRSLERTSGDVA